MLLLLIARSTVGAHLHLVPRKGGREQRQSGGGRREAEADISDCECMCVDIYKL